VHALCGGGRGLHDARRNGWAGARAEDALSDAAYVHKMSLHSGGGWGDDKRRPVPTVGNGNGARTDIPRGEGCGGDGACRCMPSWRSSALHATRGGGCCSGHCRAQLTPIERITEEEAG